jgi:hypothetical protein
VRRDDHGRSLWREVTNLRVGLAAVLISVLAFVLIYLGLKADTVWYRFAGALGAALLSVGLIGLVYEIWLRRSVVGEYLVASGLREDLYDTVIREIQHFGSINWRRFFEDTRGDLEVGVGYARTWSHSHAEKAAAIVGARGDRIKISLLDPTDPDLISFYAMTYGITPTELLNRIGEVKDAWRNEVARAKANNRAAHVVIEGVRRHVPYTFYRVGEVMWLVLAPREPGGPGKGFPHFCASELVLTRASMTGL